MDLKALYHRFRAWQKDPYTFGNTSSESHVCANCGNTFEGNYCPVCGQRFDVGRVDWISVDQELMNFWSMLDSSTLLSFILQMLGRPGYLISDYIKGRRQVCSSPTSMLVIVAIIVMVVRRFTGPVYTGEALIAGGDAGMWGKFLEWTSSNLGWGILFQTFFLIIPTWLLFRYSPRHTRHTFPDGIFIQLFMSSLVLIIVMLRSIFGNVILILIPVYYYIAYRQLFGHGVWGTLWRTLLGLGICLYFFGTAMFVSLRISGDFWAGHTTWEFLSMFGAFILLGVGVVFLGYRIGKRTARKKADVYDRSHNV